MSYHESAQDQLITRQRALIELDNHGVIFADEFDSEVKPDSNGMYKAQDVLEFLGY